MRNNSSEIIQQGLSYIFLTAHVIFLKPNLSNTVILIEDVFPVTDYSCVCTGWSFENLK